MLPRLFVALLVSCGLSWLAQIFWGMKQFSRGEQHNCLMYPYELEESRITRGSSCAFISCPTHPTVLAPSCDNDTLAHTRSVLPCSPFDPSGRSTVAFSSPARIYAAAFSCQRLSALPITAQPSLQFVRSTSSSSLGLQSPGCRVQILKHTLSCHLGHPEKR